MFKHVKAVVKKRKKKKKVGKVWLRRKKKKFKKRFYFVKLHLLPVSHLIEPLVRAQAPPTAT